MARAVRVKIGGIDFVLRPTTGEQPYLIQSKISRVPYKMEEFPLAEVFEALYELASKTPHTSDKRGGTVTVEPRTSAVIMSGFYHAVAGMEPVEYRVLQGADGPTLEEHTSEEWQPVEHPSEDWTPAAVQDTLNKWARARFQDVRLLGRRVEVCDDLKDHRVWTRTAPSEDIMEYTLVTRDVRMIMDSERPGWRGGAVMFDDLVIVDSAVTLALLQKAPEDQVRAILTGEIGWARS